MCRGAKEKKKTTLLGRVEFDLKNTSLADVCRWVEPVTHCRLTDCCRSLIFIATEKIHRIVFPATVNSRHSALHSHGFTELCTAFAVHKTNNHPVWSGCLFGASNRTRTCDTAVNSRVLYRLSY